jgi:hypothetical protein
VTQTVARNALATAVLALLNGPTGLGGMATPRRAYEWDDAPTAGGDYVLVTLSRTYGGNPRVGDYLSPSTWRMTTRAVGSVTNVGALLDRCTKALEHAPVTVGAESSTGIQFESETDVEQDEDDLSLWSGLRSWTFAF